MRVTTLGDGPKEVVGEMTKDGGQTGGRSDKKYHIEETKKTLYL